MVANFRANVQESNINSQFTSSCENLSKMCEGIPDALSSPETVHPPTMARKLEAREKAVSAATAAVISALIMNPLDVVKTRLQAQAAGFNYVYSTPNIYSTTISSHHQSSKNFEYKGTLDVISKIIRQEGVLRLWRGTNAGLALAVPTVGIYLPLYDWMLEKIESHHPSVLSPYAPLIAGSISRSIAAVVCSPIELARTRMQAQKIALHDPFSPNIISILKQIVSNTQKGQRIRVLWTGVGSQLARDVPFSAVCWSLLELIRRDFFSNIPATPSLGHVVGINFFAGLVAGSVAAAVTTPLDVAKTRRQIELDPIKGRKMSTISTLIQVWKESKFKGLFMGSVPRIGRAGPSVGIVVASYEFVKYYLHKM